MKTSYVLLMMAFTLFTGQAQENQAQLVKVGDELVLGEPSGSSFKHVAVPRKNFIIKRGGSPNVSSLKNARVTVTHISYGKKTQITFKKTSGKKFFRVYNTLTAHLEDAVESGELKIPKKG